MSHRPLPLVALIAIAAIAGCTDSEDSVVSDFGEAVAVSQVDDAGDVETVLLAADDDRVLASIYIEAATGAVDMTLGDRPVPFRSNANLPGRNLLDVNELLFAVYEIDNQTVSLSSCAGNAFATCCLAASGWACKAE